MRRYSLLKIFLNVGALLLLGLGLSVLFGWYTGSVSLIQIKPEFVPMQFNTALGFVLIGLAIAGFTNHHQPHKGNKFIGFIAMLLTILGGLTLIQHIFGVNFFIDELFMKHYITKATSTPGRMAPNTALNFLLSGIVIWKISRQKIALNQLLLSILFGALITGLGTVAYLGYLSKIETAYGWGKLTRMAVHTSVGFILVGVMLTLETWYLSLQIKQKLPSLVFPLTLSVLSFTITICLAQALYSSDLYIKSEYGNQTQNYIALGYIALGVFVFGSLFSISIAIATWFAIKYREQIASLKLAQSEILILNQQLEKLSYLDGLTEICNRRAFDIELEQELGKAYQYQYPIAVILIDIDYFKAYNDRYGHQIGDSCLQKVAHTLKGVAQRKTDVAARYGGEEFVLLLSDINLIDAEKIAAMTVNAIADLQIPHETSKASSVVTVSVGVNVCIPQLDTTPRDLIQKADRALYEAKAKGRNCFASDFTNQN